jgi:hypothetical protein
MTIIKYADVVPKEIISELTNVSDDCAQKAGLRELNEKLDTIASSNTGSGICFNGGENKNRFTCTPFSPCYSLNLLQ